MVIVAGPICTINGIQCIQVTRIAGFGFSRDLDGDTYYVANWKIHFFGNTPGLMVIPGKAGVRIVDSNGEIIEIISAQDLSERYHVCTD